MGGRLGGGGVAALANAVPSKQAIGVIWRPVQAVVPEPREAPIHAYWLPYEADTTYEMTLGAQANYFFTAGLSGCCVVVNGEPTAPRVAHVNRTEAGSAKFQAVIAQSRAVEEAMAKQRAMSQGQTYTSTTGKEAQTSREIMFQELKSKVAARQAGRNAAQDLNGYCKWGEQYHQLCGVVGVRNQATGVWSFYYQCYRNVGPPPRSSQSLDSSPNGTDRFSGSPDDRLLRDGTLQPPPPYRPAIGPALRRRRFTWLGFLDNA
jgi:hypothetical protein